MINVTKEENKEVKIIRPIYDPSFKAVFQRANSDVVKDFLQSVLSIPEDEYDYIEFADPQLHREFEKDKLSVVDMLIYTKSGKIIHVEMQLLDKDNFRQRTIYYNAKLIYKQLKKGNIYDTLEKTITILITDFQIFESPNYKRKINLRCEEGEIFDDLIEFHALELPKVPEEFDGSKLCEWAKFFTSTNMEEFNMCAEKNPKIKKAVGVLKEFSEDEKNQYIADEIEKARRDRIAEIEFGRKKGLAEGIEQGEAKKQIEIAENMLKNSLAADVISSCTSLPLETIQSLKAELGLD